MKQMRAIAFVAVFAAFLMCVPAVCGSDSDADSVDCSRYYYDQLDSLGKEIYDKAQAMTPGNTSFVVNTTFEKGHFEDFRSSFESKTLPAVTEAIHMESLYLYWVDLNVTAKYAFDDTSVAITITFWENHYYGNDIEINNLGINTVIKSVDVDSTTRLSAVKSIHDYVIGAMSYYDKTAEIPDTTDIRSLYTALVDDHVVVCEGYAKAFKAICDYYDVPCIIVTGDAGTYNPGKGITTPDKIERGGHMWNLVQMEDGKWYMVDCTWDDQVSVSLRETYLLRGSESTGFNDTPVKVSHVLKDYFSTLFTAPTLEMYAYVDSYKGGQCGDSGVYWTYSLSDCSLSFTGEGAFTSVPTEYSAYLPSVKTVTFGDGVTGVPAGILSGMTSLASIYFADTVTSVPSPIGAILKDVHGTVMTTYANVHGETFTGSDGTLQMDVREYKAVFVAGGEVVDVIPYTLLTDSITPPAVPAKTGHTGAWEPFTLVQYGVTVNAVYTKETYTITFSDPDGDYRSIKPYQYADVIVAPSYTPSKSPSGSYTYEFSGWKGFYTGMIATADALFTPEFLTIEGGTDVVAESSGSTLVVSESAVTKLKARAAADPAVRLAVKTSDGNMVLDSAAIDDLGSGDLEFAVIKWDDSKRTSDQKRTVGDYPMYCISVSGGLRMTDGKIIVTVPYTGGDTSKLKACCIEEGKICDKLDVSVSDGKAVFTTSYTSMFAIMDPDYKASDESNHPIPGVPLTTEQLTVAIVVLLILILAAAAVHHRHKS